MKEDKKEFILAKYEGLIKEHGIERVTLRELSCACGMAYGHMRYYFPQKELLIKAYFEKNYTDVTEYLKDVSVYKPSTLLTVLYYIITRLFLNGRAPIEFREYVLMSSEDWFVDYRVERGYHWFLEIAHEEQWLAEEADIYIGVRCATCSLYNLMRDSYKQGTALDYMRLYHVFCDIVFSQIKEESFLLNKQKALELFETVDKERL